MKVKKQAALYLAVLCAIYYIAPLPNLAAGSADYLMYMLYIINPLACFAANALYAANYAFFWPLPLLSGALFTPAVFIYYNGTAVIYIFSYIFLSYIGAAVGHSINKNRKTGR